MRLAEVRRSVQQVVTRGLLDLAAEEHASAAVRARVERRLQRLRADLWKGAAAGDEAAIAQRDFLVAEITRWLERRREAPPPAVAPAPPPPPGDPIGCSFAGSR